MNRNAPVAQLDRALPSEGHTLHSLSLWFYFIKYYERNLLPGYSPEHHGLVLLPHRRR